MAESDTDTDTAWVTTARGLLTLTQRPTPGTDMAESDTDTGTALVTTARGLPTLTPTTTQSTVPGGALWVWSTPPGLGTATTMRGRRSPAKTTHPFLTSNSSSLPLPIALNKTTSSANSKGHALKKVRLTLSNFRGLGDCL